MLVIFWTNLHLEFQVSSKAFKQEEAHSQSHGKQTKKITLDKLRKNNAILFNIIVIYLWDKLKYIHVILYKVYNDV